MDDMVLITGGAGFIGSHLAYELLSAGYRVRVLDNLEPQIHGSERLAPAYLAPEVELLVADVRDTDAVAHALRGVSAVFHLAARVGVGQSMYQVRSYVDTNASGTAVLLEQLLNHPVQRLVVASSISIYGEGLYRDASGGTVENAERSLEQLRQGHWEVLDSNGQPLQPVPTPESKRPNLSSIYALSKMDQERMCLLFGQAYSIPTVALRLFNTYGRHQALSNPYTGVLAIFGSRLLHRRPPLILEDGYQQRDFVHVKDVARAFRLALEKPSAANHALNVGTGRSISIRDLATEIARAVGADVEPEITGDYRTGDIRHCFADIGLARQLLGFEPQVGLDAGLLDLGEWLADQVSVDRVEQARNELLVRGLAV